MAAAKQLEVMVVDDTSVSRMLMTESLQEIGITSLSLAKDGAEALSQLKNKPVHLVISDQYMPNLDGLGLLSYESLIRRDYPVVLGTLYFFTLIGLVVKLIGDLLYVAVDRRVQFAAVAK